MGYGVGKMFLVDKDGTLTTVVGYKCRTCGALVVDRDLHDDCHAP